MDIYAYKCKKCGALHYPYRMVCKSCGENEHNGFDPVPLPTKGKLLTFTELYSLPADFMVSKMALGIVELENGIRITGQLDVGKPKIGMAVKGLVKVVREGDFACNYGMVFTKA